MTQERKEELDKFAETLVAKAQKEIATFVVGKHTVDDLMEKRDELNDEHIEVRKGFAEKAEHSAELAEMAKFKERVKTASTENLKKILTQSLHPKHVDVVVADLQKRAREDMADESIFKGALSLTHFQGLDDEDLIDAMREANDDGQHENMVRIILVVEDRFGLGYLLEKSVPEDTNERVIISEATEEKLMKILVKTQNTDVVKAVVKELDMRRAGEVLNYVGGLSVRLDEMLVEVKDLAEIAGDLSHELIEVIS